jgi:hypothetical protein
VDRQHSPSVSDSPISVPKTSERSLSDKLYTLWLALMIGATVALGFGFSYFTYAQLVASGPAVPVETMGELWDSSIP